MHSLTFDVPTLHDELERFRLPETGDDICLQALLGETKAAALELLAEPLATAELARFNLHLFDALVCAAVNEFPPDPFTLRRIEVFQELCLRASVAAMPLPQRALAYQHGQRNARLID